MGYSPTSLKSFSMGGGGGGGSGGGRGKTSIKVRVNPLIKAHCLFVIDPAPGYKTFFMLNSTKDGITTVHKN